MFSLFLLLSVVSACAPLWGQCGGTNWAGDTCCAVGSVCFTNSVWYSHCVPTKSIYNCTACNNLSPGWSCYNCIPSTSSTPSSSPTPAPSPAVPTPVPSPAPVPSVPSPAPIPSLSYPFKNIGYLPGWTTPPTAIQLSQAGYTHILVAFGVFSTTQPGSIVSAFSPPGGILSKTYFSQLQSLGLKVLFSIGGASSSLPNTTVNFHQVLALAGDSTTFINTFVNSIESLVAQYGFDGVDFDIEQGFGPATGGTLLAPGGDIQILAQIITILYSHNSKLLISLAPQTANISPNNVPISSIWGNYASLIVQPGVATTLSWVGIQLYNTGCTNGINGICYSNTGKSQDYGVAMAVDLLENWPAILNARTTVWPPYISPLNASQVVLGYPSPNNKNNSDGYPTTAPSIIQQSLSCLVNGTSCGSYVPPRAYGSIGGVFNWQVDNDALNNFNFATSFN